MIVRLVNFHCLIDVGDLLGNPSTYVEYVTKIKTRPSIYLAEFE